MNEAKTNYQKKPIKITNYTLIISWYSIRFTFPATVLNSTLPFRSFTKRKVSFDNIGTQTFGQTFSDFNYQQKIQ